MSGLWTNKEQVSGSLGCYVPEKPKKYSVFLFAFSVFYECNAAWTAKSTKSKSLIYSPM